ncbi:MAG: hypothetical protein IJZ21_04850 [Clostridia bacterium]|nr:hypothetical protein [Clostridia bacterium]
MGKNGFDFVKIDKTVIKETKYIASFVIIFSVLMQAVFLIIGKWHFTVLLGNLWGAAVAVGNFFMMGLYVQKAVSQEADDAKKTIKASQSMRFAALVLLTGIGVAVFYNNYSWISVVVPLVFPSIAIYLRPLIDKNK